MIIAFVDSSKKDQKHLLTHAVCWTMFQDCEICLKMHQLKFDWNTQNYNEIILLTVRTKIGELMIFYFRNECARVAKFYSVIGIRCFSDNSLSNLVHVPVFSIRSLRNETNCSQAKTFDNIFQPRVSMIRLVFQFLIDKKQLVYVCITICSLLHWIILNHCEFNVKITIVSRGNAKCFIACSNEVYVH